MFAARGAVTYAVRVQKEGDKFVATFPVLSCKAEGKTFEEALNNAKRVLIDFLDQQTREGVPFIEENDLSSPSTLSITVQRPYVVSIEAAKRFKVTNDYIARLCRTKKVRSFHIGRNWYVNEVSLKQFLDEMAKKQEHKWHRLSEELRREARSR